MARNRKNHSAAALFVPALKASLLCLVIGGFGVGYVWQQDQLLELGRQKKGRELRLEEYRQQNKILRDKLAQAYTPRELDARARKLNLGLAMPQPDQILRLMESAPSPTPVAAHQAGAQLAVQWAPTAPAR